MAIVQLESWFHVILSLFEQIEDENRHLRQELEQHRQKVHSQDQTIAALQSQVESLKSSASQRQGPTSSREDKEIIDMLKAQIQICTEDFQSERRDRERAHQKLSEVERELALTKRQVRLKFSLLHL